MGIKLNQAQKLIRTIALFNFDGNCISAYSFCTFFTPKFTKNANLRINFYKNRRYLRKMFG